MIRRSALLLAAVPFALALPTTAQVGTVLDSFQIEASDPVFGGRVPLGARLGAAMASPGDLDGDGVRDLVLSAPTDSTDLPLGGALWVLRLNPTGEPKTAVRISPNDPVFGGTLNELSRLGESMISVGDLDGDGRGELVVTTRNPHRLWVLFFSAEGTVDSATQILYSDPVFQPAMEKSDLRVPDLAPLGDVDGDGLGDLAFGVPFDDGPGLNRGAVWILRLQADGTPKSALKIGQNQGGLGTPLSPGDFFGTSVTALGDLDGDGNGDLLVQGGAPSLLYTLLLDDDQRVKSFTTFSIFEYALFLGGPTSPAPAPRSLETVEDLDGDGRRELLAGFPVENTPGPPAVNQGAILVGSLRDDATLGLTRPIGHQIGGLGDLPSEGWFGISTASIGDLNGDGLPEIAVGAQEANGRGSAFILFLDTDAVRNGSGVNPEVLTQVADPTLGETWTPSLDCSAQGPGIGVLVGADEPLVGQATPFGELLIDLVGGTRLFTLTGAHAGNVVNYAAPVPSDPILFGLVVHAQGLCTGAPGPQLSNALDVFVRDE